MNGFKYGYGAGRGNRTPDPRITNALLYQLSYAGTFFTLAAPSMALAYHSYRPQPLHPVTALAAMLLAYAGTFLTFVLPSLA